MASLCACLWNLVEDTIFRIFMPNMLEKWSYFLLMEKSCEGSFLPNSFNF